MKMKTAQLLNVSERDFLGYRKTVKQLNSTREKKTIVVLSDLHIGYNRYGTTHDLVAIEACRKVCLHLQPEVIVFAGDIFEFSAFSTKFRVEEDTKGVTLKCFQEASKILSSFREVCEETEFILVVGNHDQRMEDYITERASELSVLKIGDRPLHSLANYLPLDRLKIRYISQYPTSFMVHGVRVFHGHASHTKHYNNAVCASVFGHTHKLSVSWKRDVTGRQFPVVNCGFLGKYGQLSGSHGEEDWQQGFAVITVVNGLVDADAVAIRDNKCYFDGILFSGE